MTGAIACGQYSLAPLAAVQLHNQLVSAVASGVSASAPYTINSNGNATGISGSALEAWLISGTAANYEVMATLSSGDGLTVTSAALGSWLNCGTSRTWTLKNQGRDNSVITSILAVQIMDVATHTVQASATITLSAESDA